MAKQASTSKTIWLGALQSVAGLAAIAGLVAPIFGEKAAAWILLLAGVAHVVLRTVTKEPIKWGTKAEPPL